VSRAAPARPGCRSACGEAWGERLAGSWRHNRALSTRWRSKFMRPLSGEELFRLAARVAEPTLVGGLESSRLKCGHSANAVPSSRRAFGSAVRAAAFGSRQSGVVPLPRAARQAPVREEGVEPLGATAHEPWCSPPGESLVGLAREGGATPLGRSMVTAALAAVPPDQVAWARARRVRSAPAFRWCHAGWHPAGLRGVERPE
jgi:hypothetical protein